MKKIIKEKNQVVLDEVLSKVFLSQFKTRSRCKQIPEEITCSGIGKDA